MGRNLGWLAAAALALVLVAQVTLTTLRPMPARGPALPAGPSGEATPTSSVTTAVGSVRAVVERVKPAVAQITSEQVVLDRLGRPVPAGTGVGSGILYDPTGLILTNNHVIEGARSLLVSLPDGRTYTGRLLGGDPEMDLAVVKIDPQAGETLPLAALGDAEALSVGDAVVAIGNALGLPGGPTVTTGVVSALGRAVQEPSDSPDEPGPYLYDLIQTDAAINPGNSGGPLLNMAGEVVGINTLAAGGSGETIAQGIGFAIAINAARPIANQLATGGKVIHPFLGVTYAFMNPALAARLGVRAQQGVVVGQAVPGGPAARAGLRAGDVITAVDGGPIVDETTLGRALNRRRPGDRIKLTVTRGGEQLTLDVTLGERLD